MFHSERGRTRVPVFGCACTRPFAASTRMASRSTVRLTVVGAQLLLGRKGVAGLELPAKDPQSDRVDDLSVEAASRIGAPLVVIQYFDS